MDKIRLVLFLQFLLLMWLGLDYRLVNAQSMSCPLITINNLGNTTDFSTNGLVAQAIVPPGEAASSVPVRITNFTKVCDAAGDRINTSSFVSVVVEFQCDFQSSTAGLAVCSDSSNIVTREYQFQCIEQNGQPVWGSIVSGSNLFVQTLNPTATLSTPLADQCRRCIDDQQSSRADPITHCDPCPSRCNQGQGHCYLGFASDICCNFYLQDNCTEECPSPLVNANSVCVCPSLSLANGDVSYLPADRSIGSVATYTCNPGYRLSSPQAGMTRTCSINGWSSQIFTCVVQCPDLSDSIENGEVVVTPTVRTVNSTAEYSCNDGYMLDNGDAERTCQAEGTWSGEAPQCFIQCPDLSDSIENGEVVITPAARTVNSTAEYSCDDGYRLDNGDAERTCQAGGTWSGEAPQCFVQCPDLGDSMENGEVVITPTARTVNSTAEYSCNDGYRLDNGDAERTCQAEGTWSGEAPQCFVQCPDLSDSIENGEVVITPTTRTVNSTAEYSCNDGYRLDNGDAERTCLAEGTWSGKPPQCFIQCPDLGDSIENGKVFITPTARTVNSMAEYSCDDGYKLDKGDAKRTCQDGGTWSGEAPQCIPLDKRSNIPAIAGGVVGGLVDLGIILSLIIGIIIVAIKLRKKEPDGVEQHKSKIQKDNLKDILTLKEFLTIANAEKDNP